MARTSRIYSCYKYQTKVEATSSSGTAGGIAGTMHNTLMHRTFSAAEVTAQKSYSFGLGFFERFNAYDSDLFTGTNATQGG